MVKKAIVKIPNVAEEVRIGYSSAGEHEEGSLHAHDEHLLRCRDAVASVLGLGAVLGRIALVGQLQCFGLAAVYLVLIESGLLEAARNGDASVSAITRTR